MPEKRIIHFDSIYSNKIDLNPFNTTFVLSQTLHRVSHIFLKSVEIPISNNNISSPYSSITIKYNNAFFYYTLPNKTYTLFISDLNALILPMQASMSSTEICPIFSVSTTELNKLVLKVSLLSTNSIYIYSTGIISYYLEGITLIPTTKTLISNTLYLHTFNLINVYNLCFDTYYNLTISNLENPTSNNNNYTCHFKLIANTLNNSIYFSGESNSFIQDIHLNIILNKY